MNCKYSIKEEENENGRHYLTCTVTNERCHAIRYCSKVRDIINTDNFEKYCNIYKNKGDALYMKEGKNKVVLEKNGMLYVQVDEKTVQKIKNPFDYIPKGVDAIKSKTTGKYYIKGYFPK